MYLVYDSAEAADQDKLKAQSDFADGDDKPLKAYRGCSTRPRASSRPG
jgi:hypothetical protein